MQIVRKCDPFQSAAIEQELCVRHIRGREVCANWDIVIVDFEFLFISFLRNDYSSAQDALIALKKKKVNVKYARDESTTHNTLASTQSLDSNGNTTKKTTIVREEFVFDVYFPVIFLSEFACLIYTDFFPNRIT